MDRRGFLRLAGGAAAAAAFGGGCDSDSEQSEARATAASRGSGPGGGERTLRIAQWSHFVPAYDAWFDKEFSRRWGEEHDIEVVVDHIPFNEVTPRAGTEVARGEGHDIFGFVWESAARFEDQMIDHREIVEEVSATLGPMHPFVERSIFNPKTKKYLGFSDYWVPNLTHYRSDLWSQVGAGRGPASWDDVLEAGRRLKAMGHPLGLSMGVGDPDANVSLIGLLNAFGGSIQDEDGNLALDRPATVEAVKFMAAVYRSGMTDEVFSWDGTSNNRYLAGGTGSMILNPVSAIRAIEQQTPELAAMIGLSPLPAGPAGNLSPYAVGTYVVWKFARNAEAAKQFLVDLAPHSRDELVRSAYYNLPSFPGAVPDLGDVVGTDPAGPPDRYALLLDAQTWTTNMGHPGHSNAAVQEVFDQALVVKMFAAAARGELSAEEAVMRAHDQAAPIFERWREQGKI